MNYINAKYLKHAGKMIDVKVSIKKINGKYIMHIRDCEFTSFDKALRYLRFIAETEIVADKVIENTLDVL